MNSFLRTLVLVMILPSVGGAQPLSSDSSDRPMYRILSKQWIRVIKAPVLLAVAGVYTISDDALLYKNEIREERNEAIPYFNNHLDDYLQYAPIAAVYGLNMVGIKGENNFGNRTALLIKSETIVALLVFSLKEVTAVPRPDNSTRNSFPSGHTAQAFAAATFMHKEYGKQSMWYSIGAYTLASGIGVMRVMNNRHWVSDVLAGAGLGILSTNLAYVTHQYRWGKKEGNTTILPAYNGQTISLSLHYRFQ